MKIDTSKRFIAVIGLGFGDETKGATVDALCRALPVGLVVRHNGGCQAAHNVVTEPDKHGKSIHHTFSQYGSGTFGGVPTYLSKHMLFNPIWFLAERAVLREKLGGLPVVYVDERARIVTPFHERANKVRSKTLEDGTTGAGIGETVEDSMKFPGDVLTVGDLKAMSLPELEAKLTRIWSRLRLSLHGANTSQLDNISVPKVAHLMLECVKCITIAPNFKWVLDKVPTQSHVVFEGAQGVLLDEDYGFTPHTTWSCTRMNNVYELLEGIVINPRGHTSVIGVTRSYSTRHGAGPLPTEDPNQNIPEPHNDNTTSMAGAFRQGPLDLPMLQYAIACVEGGVDYLAMSHVDWIPQKLCVRNNMTYAHNSVVHGDMSWHASVCKLAMQKDMPSESYVRIRYTIGGHKRMPEEVAERLGLKLCMVATSPTAESRVAYLTEQEGVDELRHAI